MKKVLLLLIVFSLIFTCILYGGADDWYYWGKLADISGCHGTTVDPEGKIWANGWSDSLEVPVKILNPDGTEASFSPISEVTIDGVTWETDRKCRGITLDHQGNILLCANDVLIRINYQDGSGMKALDMPYSLTKPGVDENGYIYIALVDPSAGVAEPTEDDLYPIWILDADFEEYNEVATPASDHWSRAIEVTPDGTHVYYGTIWNAVVDHYYSEDGPEGWYDQIENLPGPLSGFFNGDVAGLNWDRDGKLWVSSMGAKALYAYDMTTLEFVEVKYDSLENPRGVSFSLGGDTAYVADATRGEVHILKKGVEPESIVKDNNVPKSFNLLQNYPNPFNPTTEIEFQIMKRGYVKLTVFDILGHQVEEIVNRDLDAGEYSVTFTTGGDCSSGIYLYRLQINDQATTKRMLLMK